MNGQISELSICEIKSILIDNDFKYIENESDDINDYFSLGQLLNKIKEPIGIKELFELVSMTGTVRYINKKEYPNNPEFCVFTVKKDEFDNDKIAVLYKKSFIDEIEKILNTHEVFLSHMKEINKMQMIGLLDERNKVSIAIDTTGLNPLKNKIISISMIEFNNNGDTIREYSFFIDNEWNEEDVELYTKKSETSKKMSAYDYLKLDLPNMNPIAKNVFTNPIDVLRIIYKMTKNKNIIIENKNTIEFIDNFFKYYGIDEQNYLSKIINSIIEPSRISKIQKNEYIKRLRDLKDKYQLNINRENNYYAYGRSIDLKDIAIRMIKTNNYSI